MNILILDGQGGGVGRALVEGVRQALPDAHIVAIGANAMATAAMLRAGADAAATGETPVIVCAKDADVIAGPIGIVLKDAMLGEITGAMAAAVAESPAQRVLVPSAKCSTTVAGTRGQSLQALIESAVNAIAEIAEQQSSGKQ